jgi:hypothetical protein
VLIHDLPLRARFDPRLAFAVVVRADIALLVGPGTDNVCVGYGDAVVSIDASGGLPSGAVARGIVIEEGGEVILDRRLALNPERRPERGDDGVVGEGCREGIGVVLLSRNSSLPADLGDLFGRPGSRSWCAAQQH